MGNKLTISTYLWTISLNVNGVSAPVKRHRRLSGKKTRPLTRAASERPTSHRRHRETESGGQKRRSLQMPAHSQTERSGSQGETEQTLWNEERNRTEKNTECTVTKTQTQPEVRRSAGGWMKKSWSRGTMECDWVVKNNKTFPFAATWMDPQCILLSEMRQIEKDIYQVTSLTCGI